MRKVLAALALTSVIVRASAASPQQSTFSSKLLAATKTLTAKACRPHTSFGGNYYVSRCMYVPPMFVDGEWGVTVHFVLEDKNGKFVPVQGSDAIYVFNKAGKFIKVIPGM